VTNAAPSSSTSHDLKLGVRSPDRFVGACSCGWFSEAMPTAGLVHGAHGGHVASLAARAG
jgi:hypothetical protein